MDSADVLAQVCFKRTYDVGLIRTFEFNRLEVIGGHPGLARRFEAISELVIRGVGPPAEMSRDLADDHFRNAHACLAASASDEQSLQRRRVDSPVGVEHGAVEDDQVHARCYAAMVSSTPRPHGPAGTSPGRIVEPRCQASEIGKRLTHRP